MKNTNMAESKVKFSFRAKLDEAVYFVSSFVVTRYPYACAVFLMLTTAEVMKAAVTVEATFLNMIYAHLGVFFLAGTTMAFNLFGTKRLFAIITALQFAVLSVESYLELKNKESILVKWLYLSTTNNLISKEQGGTVLSPFTRENKIAYVFGATPRFPEQLLKVCFQNNFLIFFWEYLHPHC